MPNSSDQDMRCRYEDSVNKILSNVFDSAQDDQCHYQTHQYQYESEGAGTQSPSFPTFDITKLSKWQVEYSKEKKLECDSAVRALKIQRGFEILQDNLIEHTRHAQALSIACQFHKYVVLLKHFDNWFERTKRRKEALQLYRQLMRKILLLWQSHAEEQRQRRISIYLINQYVNSFQSRVLRYALIIWSERCLEMTSASRVFMMWRLITTRSSLEYESTMERLELKLKQKVLKRWRYVVIIQMHIRQRQHYQLEQLITTWKRYSEESILKWKLAIRSAESLSDEISFKRIGRVFDFMREYATKTRQTRSAYLNIASNHRCRLVRETMKRWKQYVMIEKKKRRVLSRVFSRRFLLEWNHFVFLEKKNENILGRIILNRWRIFAENRIEHRSIAFRAMRHWARYLCRAVLRNWSDMTVRRRGRLRSPVPQYRQRFNALPQVQYTTRHSRQISRDRIGMKNRQNRKTSYRESAPNHKRISFNETVSGMRPERRTYGMRVQNYSRRDLKPSLVPTIGPRSHFQHARHCCDTEEFTTRQRSKKLVDTLPTPPSTSLPTWVTRALSERVNSKSLKTNRIRNLLNIDIDGFRAEGKHVVSRLQKDKEDSSSLQSRFQETETKMRIASKPVFYSDAKMRDLASK